LWQPEQVAEISSEEIWPSSIKRPRIKPHHSASYLLQWTRASEAEWGGSRALFIERKFATDFRGAAATLALR
jgi:hypothetical protein